MKVKRTKVGRLNRAVLWQLQMCLGLLDRLGYRVAAAYVSSAVDALTAEALSGGEISEMDLAREEHVNLVLAMFEKHGKVAADGPDSFDEETDVGRPG